MKHPRRVRRGLVWWYGVGWLAAALVGGYFWGTTGAGVGLLAALIVNGFAVELFEFWYPSRPN